MAYAFSEKISAFLDFLRDADGALRYAKEQQTLSEQQTQDILHSIELDSHNAVELIRLTKLLKEVRQGRRTSKDEVRLLEPICQWAEQNKGALKALERLLGDERKIERNMENRTYVQRTDILQELHTESR